MKVVLEGKINRLYVQSLCMMFFRGEKFPENEQNPKGEICVKARDLENGISCEVLLNYDGKAASSKTFELYSVDEKYERTSKTAVGRAVFDACIQLTNYIPPWGLLTGIRPSAVAQELIEKHGKHKATEILIDKYLLSKEKAELAISVAENEYSILSGFGDDTCSLYISIPFCPSRCSYCSFISYATPKLFQQIPAYVDKIINEIDDVLRTIKAYNLRLVSIYIGGGTPTILNLEQLERVLSALYNGATDDLMEFTLEGGRPDTIDADKLNLLKKYGVNRISVNPQSLNDEVLHKIGRNHTVEDFYKAYDLVKKSGIKIINTDLIAGLDGDSFDSFKKTIDSIVELSPDNVTVHSFSVKKSARILEENKDIYNCDGDFAIKSVDYAYKVLTSNGYIPYYMYKQKNTVSDLENVGYAKPGTFGAYNVLMMGDGHTVFGVGAGATTKLIKKTSGKAEILRIFSPKYPYEYLQDNQNSEQRIVDFFKKEGKL